MTSKHPPPAGALQPSSSSVVHTSTKLPSSATTQHVHYAYDRLEGYQHAASPQSPNKEDNELEWSPPRISSPTRCTSTNSDFSQASVTSQKSSGSGRSHKQASSQGSIPAPKQRPRSNVSSTSSSRTPTPTVEGNRMRKSMSNSSTDYHCATTEESSQESTLSSYLMASQGVSTDEVVLPRKISLDHCITSASPEPEIRTMSALATNTVQALSTLMEVVTPTSIQPPTHMSVEKQHSTTTLPAKEGENLTLNTSSRLLSGIYSRPTSTQTTTTEPNLTHAKQNTTSNSLIPGKKAGFRKKKPPPLTAIHIGGSQLSSNHNHTSPSLNSADKDGTIDVKKFDVGVEDEEFFGE